MDDLRQLAATFLPGEGQLNLAQIRITGNEKMAVENHQGIISYSDGHIKISTKDGLLSVWGKELEILHVDREVMELVGKIERLEFGQ